MLIDPTKKAIFHWIEAKEYILNNKRFTGNIQPDYYEIIDPYINDVKIDKIKYLNEWLWSKKDSLKFYKQTNPDYVSQSLVSTIS